MNRWVRTPKWQAEHDAEEARIGSFGNGVPKEITIVTTSIGSPLSSGPAQLVTPCDPAIHPVIVDFETGKIESLNPGALAQLKITDS